MIPDAWVSLGTEDILGRLPDLRQGSVDCPAYMGVSLSSVYSCTMSFARTLPKVLRNCE
jgi:hypothetical protein